MTEFFKYHVQRDALKRLIFSIQEISTERIIQARISKKQEKNLDVKTFSKLLQEAKTEEDILMILKWAKFDLNTIVIFKIEKEKI